MYFNQQQQKKLYICHVSVLVFYSFGDILGHNLFYNFFYFVCMSVLPLLKWRVFIGRLFSIVIYFSLTVHLLMYGNVFDNHSQDVAAGI